MSFLSFVIFAKEKINKLNERGTKTKTLHFDLDMSEQYVAVVGDVGGTNARLQLFWYLHDHSTSIRQVIRQTYRTNTFTGLAAILQRFLDDAATDGNDNDVSRAIEQKK